jgi:hypothetical protein
LLKLAVTDEEWASIANMIDRTIATNIGRRRDFFMIGTVNKRDTKNNLIWIKEMKDVRIPIFTFDYKVVYYDESPRGAAVSGYKTYKKEAEVTPKLPEIGDEVLIAKEMGNDLLPRCLGVLRSKNWIEDLEDD